MYSTAGARAAPKTRAGAVNTTTAHVLRSLQELCPPLAHMLRLQAGAANLITDARAAIIAGDSAMHPTAGARAAIKQSASVTPQRPRD